MRVGDHRRDELRASSGSTLSPASVIPFPQPLPGKELELLVQPPLDGAFGDAEQTGGQASVEAPDAVSFEDCDHGRVGCRSVRGGWEGGRGRGE